MLDSGNKAGDGIVGGGVDFDIALNASMARNPHEINAMDNFIGS